jgi:NitT/TauT family transport system ATP-binding protein
VSASKVDAAAQLTRGEVEWPSREANLHEARIGLEHVSKCFTSLDGRQYVAIDDFNLQLADGEFFCLLGPSGCGKTSILNMIAGFERPSTGRVLMDRQDILGPGRERGVVFQGDDSLFGWLTAQENVEFGLMLRNISKDKRHELAEHFLALVGLAGQGHKFPGELSGGMKQRIQIARVLANEPTILLMDEPFGALDAQTRTLMQEELRRIWGLNKVLVVFVTHDIDEAVTLSTRVGVMSAGPGSRLKDVISVDMGDKRERHDPAYLRIYDRIHETIRAEVAKAKTAAGARP